MTGIEISLAVAVANLVGVIGGKTWERKSIESKYLPRIEHGLTCKNVMLSIEKKLAANRDEIIQAIKTK